MFWLIEVIGTVIGAGFVAAAAPTLVMARKQTEGAATTAIVRMVIGGVILMAAWKLFFSEQAVLTPSPSAQVAAPSPMNAGVAPQPSAASVPQIAESGQNPGSEAQEPTRTATPPMKLTEAIGGPEVKEVAMQAKADVKQKAKHGATANAAVKSAQSSDDELDRILAAQKAEAERNRPGAASGEESDEGGSDVGGLTQAEVNNVASRANQKVMNCYMLHGDVDAGEETIKITLHVNGDGSVGFAKATGKRASDAVGKCVIKEVMALAFPQTSGPAKKYTVKYTVGM